MAVAHHLTGRIALTTTLNKGLDRADNECIGMHDTITMGLVAFSPIVKATSADTKQVTSPSHRNAGVLTECTVFNALSNKGVLLYGNLPKYTAANGMEPSSFSR